MLRSCYTGSMKFAEDSDETFLVDWYFVDNMDFIPFPSAYTSHVWNEVHPDDPCPVGEVDGPTTYRNGSKPVEAMAYTGEFCGDADQWAGDITLADLAQPQCPCGPRYGAFSVGFNLGFKRCTNVVNGCSGC